jgi:hypothetical protein
LIGGTGMSPGRPKLLTAMLFAMSVPMAYGQTVDHIASDHESTSDHENTHGSLKNVISIFTGVTHAGRRENGAALGVGHERLLSDSLAVGVLAEHTFGFMPCRFITGSIVGSFTLRPVSRRVINMARNHLFVSRLSMRSKLAHGKYRHSLPLTLSTTTKS